MKIFTIGFTKTTAENFFSRLSSAGVKKIIDARLKNGSQLSGFAKAKDLKFFSKQLCNANYVHDLNLAPTQEILDAYKKKEITWGQYEERFNNLMKIREIEKFEPKEFENACLLCSEDKPHFCHRRLVVEYLKEKWGNVEIIHL
tara:strand:- start:361 stop:792 length:432 start_codon:yes stop_codon:yes gene_type:complete